MSVTVLIRTATNDISIDTAKLSFKGVESVNQLTAAKLTTSWLSHLSTSPLRTVRGQKPRKCFTHFLTLLIEDIYSVIKDCSVLADEFLYNLEQDDFSSPRSTAWAFSAFKKLPIFAEFHAFIRTKDPELLRYILTFLWFGKKTEFEREEFYTTALRRWKQVEERISNHVLDHELVIRVRDVIAQLLPDPSFSHFMGKNGPGAVFGDERGDIEKADNLTVSPKLSRLLSEANPLKVVDDESGEGAFFRMLFPKVEKNHDCSRLMFVPKNYKTARSICMEPTPVMFFQQGIRWELEDKISSSVFGRYVQINDQGRNQIGAVYGSEYQTVDTTDLSAASDSVKTDLVRLIFPRRWRYYLLASRTSQVLLPDGTVTSVSKFAPMGSALCFPVQSLIYCATVIVSYIQYYCESLQTEWPTDISSWLSENVSDEFSLSSTKFFESIAVYGDDIICDSRTTYDVIRNLEALGFEVNTSKSFTGQRDFRESCGIFAYKGEDVTPIIPKFKHLKPQYDADSLSRDIAIANAMGDAGYYEVRRVLIHWLFEHGAKHGKVNPVIFSDRTVADTTQPKDALTIYTTSPRNSHIKQRENPNLQRLEARGWVTYSRKTVRPSDVDPYSQYDLYSYHLSTRAAGFPEDISEPFSSVSFIDSDKGLSRRKVSIGTKLGWGWTPI